MAKFNFTLEKVLRHRRVLQETAEREFHEAQAVLNAEIAVLERMLDQRHRAFGDRHRREVQGGAAAGALTQVHEFLRGQDFRIERQRKKIQEIEIQVENLREALRQKAIDTKIMEGLRERKFAEFRKDQAKTEQKRLDDISSTRFVIKDEE